MSKRTDLRKILIIGSGPIVIGQACEFDYSGTQAVKALREEGFEVVLVNSNPATIMTDPELAHRTYVEPLTPEFVARIIERERPQALLPTLGGQTGLTLAVALAEDGTLDRFGVELIGAKLPAIKKAEDRALFKQAMERIRLALPRPGPRGGLGRGSSRRWSGSGPRCRAPATCGASTRRARSSGRSATRRSSGRRSRSAARAAPSPTTPRSWKRRSAGGSRCRRSAPCGSRRR